MLRLRPSRRCSSSVSVAIITEAKSSKNASTTVQTKLLHETGGARTFALVFDAGDEVTDGLLRFARAREIGAARFTAIGALREATLGFFSVESKDYKEIPIEEQTEVLSMTGNLALYEGEPKLHAHAVLGRPSGEALGGHVLQAIARPTLEVMLTASPTPLHREIDDVSTLPLLTLDE